MYKIQFNKPTFRIDYDGIFASLTLRLWYKRQKPVTRILHVSESSDVSRISLTHLFFLWNYPLSRS